jgi:predicted Abi (CAAX) family protease
MAGWSSAAWGALSLGLFVAYHPLAGRLWYPQGRRLFEDGRFLLLTSLLGLVCVIAYQVTGSLWPPVLIHWLVVVIWLELLGGRRRLTQG